MEIEELHDLKIDRWDDPDLYRKEPLLEYVWQVAEKFCMTCYEDGYCESIAPTIFANRYFESKLNIEERYNRFKEIHPNLNCSFEEYADIRKNEKLLDASFQNKYLNNEDLQNTIEAFGLDVSKFWYLMLFVYDYIEDFATNAPEIEKSTLETLNEFSEKLSEATTIILKKGNRKSLEIDRSETIDIVWAAMQYYIKTYNDIINQDIPREDILRQLEEKEMFCPINGNHSISRDKKRTLDISYKKWKFAEMFLFFLEDKKAVTLPNRKIKVSKDKMMLISRLIYTVGYDTARYNEEYDSEGNKNRMLSNLLRRYSKEKFPTVFGQDYLM